jgi:predicted amidohydrolase
VFEVAFDSDPRSKRHKSGLAMRFPRISRIRWDKPAHEADRIDALQRDRTVLPGLIDAHVHLAGDPGTPFWQRAIRPDELSSIIGVKNALLTARAGFTTVRDLGASGNGELCSARRDPRRDRPRPADRRGGRRIWRSSGAMATSAAFGRK